VGGTGVDGAARLVCFHKIRGTQTVDLPVTGGGRIASLLSVGRYLFLSIDRAKGDAVDATIWKTATPRIPGRWIPVGTEIGRGRRHVHSIKFGIGWGDEILAGTARATPGGMGAPGTGAEVWRSADYGSRWEQIAVDGFGNPNTGAVPVLESFRYVWGGIHIYASAMNHPDGSTVYKHQSSGSWNELPYVSGFG
jgi:hypothetical protein